MHTKQPSTQSPPIVAQRGFTIIELLIVIVVIGILAAITIVAYNGLQGRARDTIRKSDLESVSQALNLYNIDNASWVGTGSGCGYNGDGSGWFSHVNGTSYPKSVSNCLKEAGYIKKDITDPTGGTTSSPTVGFSYMKYHCGTGASERVYVYAKLESMPQDEFSTDGTCSSTLDTSYGMNYYVQVK